MKRLLTFPGRWLRLIRISVQMSLGQIWANKLRSLLATLGIVIGIASVVAVIASLAGLKAKILAEFETFGANKLYASARRPDTGPDRHTPRQRLQFTPAQINCVLEHCPSIKNFTRVAETRTNVNYASTRLERVEIYGIDYAWHTLERRSVQSGRPFGVVDQINARPVCLITPQTRDDLKLPQDPSGHSIEMFAQRFTIVGVVDPDPSGNMFGDNGPKHEIFIPFPTLYRITEPGVYLIVIAHSPQVAHEASAELRMFLRKRRQISPDDPDTFRIQVLSEYIQQFQSLAAGVTAVAAGIVSISLLVGGVGIMNIMLVSVSERTREIGLRKAVGAKPTALLLQFLIESVTLCSVGGLIGLVLGQGLVEAIKRIPHANLEQAAIPLWAVLLSLIFASGVGVTFGFFPALKAARLDPIEALRHE